MAHHHAVEVYLSAFTDQSLPQPSKIPIGNNCHTGIGGEARRERGEIRVMSLGTGEARNGYLVTY